MTKKPSLDGTSCVKQGAVVTVATTSSASLAKYKRPGRSLTIGE
jgi:hypothetical protein